MQIRMCLRLTMMAAGRKKKTLFYSGLGLALMFAVIQVTYFNEAYSPLQVLADARSEAKRLLKFITLYHVHCNATIQVGNMSNWPICMEKPMGGSFFTGNQKVAYSIGPSGDFAFERILAVNLSFHVYIFHHLPVPKDIIYSFGNRTYVLQTAIVPNEPADFGRNSYGTQTINNMMESQHHTTVDVLKIDLPFDTSRSHELFYYMIKDRVLQRVKELHLSIYVDKVDDDYLYSWYRVLYNLFHSENFRLYHSASSDPLCLQVTLMESCVYYMSWIKDPGPQTFILYPPAIDGSEEFEMERLLDYLEDTDTSCADELEVALPMSKHIHLCQEKQKKDKGRKCQLVIIRNSDNLSSISAIPGSTCSVINLSVHYYKEGDFVFQVSQKSVTRASEAMSIQSLMTNYFMSSTTSHLYIEVNEIWDLLSPLLDSGIFQNIYQVILDIKDMWRNMNSLELRQRYSELRRIEMYNFNKYKVDQVTEDSSLNFKSTFIGSDRNGHYRINYLQKKYRQKMF
ncbi:hypothetical protein CHS0354_013788 [Potamilus streckersoni]|uniref:Uncharacterized protein n=1 Tax=Potamilus streckersoni TaxID=2493646 RepID=A0AAE0SGG9_9BIVA|nr:hypothetical protein CHS0354_013788 [Potamilus streckersoni]